MEKQYFVYILANGNNSTLYIGVTNDLYRRIMEHKTHQISGFTDKYNVNKLVYFECAQNIQDALNREKQLKNWHREWKFNLVKSTNPQFKDLSADIGLE
ncbi:MAG: GIY-YIG nuclease family protein [Cyanobacteriota bacterium]|jgi:putative endonuclease|nr:GIY-YIG nuclease family protein [Cyanobacteriota bacterium]